MTLFKFTGTSNQLPSILPLLMPDHRKGTIAKCSTDYSSMSTHTRRKQEVVGEMHKKDTAIAECSSAAILVGAPTGLGSHIKTLTSQGIANDKIHVCELNNECFKALVLFNRQHNIIPMANLHNEDVFKIAKKLKVDHIDADAADSGEYAFDSIVALLDEGIVKSLHWTITTRNNPLIAEVAKKYGWERCYKKASTYYGHPEYTKTIRALSRTIFAPYMEAHGKNKNYKFFFKAYQGANRSPMMGMVFSRDPSATQAKTNERSCLWEE